MATVGLKILSPEKHLWVDQELRKVYGLLTRTATFLQVGQCWPGGGSVGVNSHGLIYIQSWQLRFSDDDISIQLKGLTFSRHIPKIKIHF